MVDFGRVNPLSSTHIAGPRGADQIQQIWWLEWAQFALAHGQNLFFTGWQNYPVGLNAVVSPTSLALGVLISPITTLFGPAVAWNLLVRLALVASALSMCLALRRWTNWWPAAFVGGLVYGFSTYQTFLANQYLFLVFVPLPPLFFLLLHEFWVHQRWKPSRTGALLGLICGVQYLISSEILASMVLIGAIASVFYLLANRHAYGGSYAKRAGKFALVVGMALLAVPVAQTLFGPGHLHGVPNSQGQLGHLHSDLLGLFIPYYALRLTTAGLNNFWDAHLGSTATMYLGIPLIVLLTLVVVLLRRRGIVLMAGSMMAISMVLSLGSVLFVAGRDTHIPMPFDILAHLPLANALLASRFSLYTSLFGGVLAAIGISALHEWVRQADRLSRRDLASRERIRAAGAALAVAVVALLPLLPSRVQTASATGDSSFFTSRAAMANVPAGSVVLAYPYPDSPIFPGAIGYSFLSRYQAINDVLLDQAVTGLPFRLIGGYGWRPNGATNSVSPTPLHPQSVDALFDLAFYGVLTRSYQARLLTSSDLTADLRSFLHEYRVGTVVVLPQGQDPATVTRAITAAIGPPAYTGRTKAWFHVQLRLRTTTPKPSPPLTSSPMTRVLKPADGQRLNGEQFLVAQASANFGVTKVAFHITGEGRTVVEPGVTFPLGWIGGWNTKSVPDGTYTVTSVAYGITGLVAKSPGIVVKVMH
jgi:hypothetical protein